MPVQADSLFGRALSSLSSTRTERVGFSDNALMLLRERYLACGPGGEVAETPEEFLRRVAVELAKVEDGSAAERWAEAFYEIMARLEFHPGSRTLANAGTARPQLANCFVFPLEDSQESILRTFSESSTVKGMGGGCGFNYSRIRPRGDDVRGAPGLAAGPVAFLKMFDDATKLFRQRGHYESGNMAVLNVDHPDALDFIAAKRVDGALSMTNISLGVPDAFMRAVESDTDWALVNPRTRSVVRTVPAREVFAAACAMARDTGDPGLIFLDHMNRENPLRDDLGDIVATNPCGEIGLYPYEACNLGYVNLPRLLAPDARHRAPFLFDEERLRTAVAVGVRMIDNAISLSWFPIPSIRRTVAENRRVGLGVTGWAECLATARIPYDSEEALECAERLAALLRDAAEQASFALAVERGPFPNVNRSRWRDADRKPRNVAVLALPPSGNNAVIFDTSFSIEPFFGMTYTQRVLGGRSMSSVNRLLLDAISGSPRSEQELLARIAANGGSVRGVDGVPEEVQRIFGTAHDIAPEFHVRMQAAFQRHVDNAVTKTANLPSAATPDDVAAVYLQAWRLGCKGITVYRDRSRSEQAIEWTRAPLETGPDQRSCDVQEGTCTACE
ncbi:adenosylcobalamin-dependent ribonucleoside-diphosphate reductase [Amycolatopsis samaneae]|uniref:Vitamin B12-dependent ribonucleotide reductase n=1 Tax=Amycolatopsis samaneae TaxID=664691 RepID=A0ABW5GEG7_9PSEU